MDLAGFKYNFTAPPLSSSSQILMGQTSCSGGTARLNVYDDILGEGIFGYSSTSGNNTGVHGLGVDQGNLGVISVGVLGETQPFTINKGIGVSGFVGTANYGSLPLTGISIGVYGNSISNGGMWAGYFDGDVITVHSNNFAGKISFDNPTHGLSSNTFHACADNWSGRSD